LGAGAVIGRIEDVLNEVDVQLSEPNERVTLSQLGGYYVRTTVKATIRRFIEKTGNVYAIFTARAYSFAIFKHGDSTYLFNSHSCTPTGRHGGKGFASIIKFLNSSLKELNNNIGLYSIGDFLCNLNQPSSRPSENDQFSLSEILVVALNDEANTALANTSIDQHILQLNEDELDLSTALANMSIDQAIFQSNNIYGITI
jgi:hypothetical protein